MEQDKQAGITDFKIKSLLPLFTKKEKTTMTPTCLKKWYGMFHGGHSELSQRELL